MLHKRDIDPFYLNFGVVVVDVVGVVVVAD